MKKLILLVSVLILTACTQVRECPPPSNDLLTPSGELWTTDGDPEKAATVIPHNGEVLMADRDRVSRWQNWWEGCKTL
ncbi:putative outer membrane spanin subunit [Klebsiella phage BUCT_49532]|uniref:Rz-like spanin n=1 Tax=Klebsiella phage BUCT_49532 TaxID=2849971 RepID=UPI001C79410A|nr:Rz-like spanin [Klebsiella phage BUCT_49532]WCI99742.1 putative outer membrane spanin subunit [Klebsiella phage BUCT_49532]